MRRRKQWFLDPGLTELHTHNIEEERKKHENTSFAVVISNVHNDIDIVKTITEFLATMTCKLHFLIHVRQTQLETTKHQIENMTYTPELRYDIVVINEPEKLYAEIIPKIPSHIQSIIFYESPALIPKKDVLSKYSPNKLKTKYIVLGAKPFYPHLSVLEFQTHTIGLVHKDILSKLISLQYHGYSFNAMERMYLLKYFLNVNIEYCYITQNDCITENKRIKEINEVVTDKFFTQDILIKSYDMFKVNTTVKGLVTVVLLTFNKPYKCLETIKMILKQTYHKFELIIINDGSTEDYAYVRKFIEDLNDHRLTYIFQKINKKIPSTLNEALKICSGEYFTWISDDNEYLDTFIEDLYDDRYNYIFSDWGCKSIEDKHLATVEIHNVARYRCIQNIRHPSWGKIPNVNGSFIGTASFMWRTNFLKSIYGWEDGYHGIEDYEILLKTFLHTRSIKYVNKCLMYYIHWHEKKPDSTSVRNSIWSPDIQRKNAILLLPHIREKYYDSVYKWKENMKTPNFPTSIPQKAFTFWHGDEFTFLQYLCIETIAYYNPSFEVIIYTIQNITTHRWPKGELSVEIKSQTDWFKKITNLSETYKNIKIEELRMKQYEKYPANTISDFVRWQKMYDHGGVWFDTDIIFVQPLHYLFKDIVKNCPLDKLEFIISIYKNKGGHRNGYTPWFPCGLLMGAAGNVPCRELVTIMQSAFDKEDYNAVGPNLAKKMFQNIDFMFQHFTNVGVFNDDLIYPFDWNETAKYFKSSFLNHNIVGLHWYNGASPSRHFLNQISEIIDKDKFFIKTTDESPVTRAIVKLQNLKTYTHRKFNICCVIDEYEWALHTVARNIKNILEKELHHVYIYRTKDLVDAICCSNFDIHNIHLYILLNSYDKNVIYNKTSLCRLLPKERIIHWVCDHSSWINNPNVENMLKGRNMLFDTIENSSITLVSSYKIKDDLSKIGKDKGDYTIYFPYLCNIEYFTYKGYKNVKTPKLIVGWAGNASPHCHGWLKGLQYIKNVVYRHPDKFEFVYKNKFEGNGISYAEMPAFYETIDIYVCYSLYEGTPNTILEASSCGKAWISTAVGNVPEMLSFNPLCGILIERDESKLEEALLRLFYDRDQLVLLGQNARQVIEKHFNYKNITLQTFQYVFDELLPI